MTDPSLVSEALENERPQILPLPANPFPCDFVVGTASGKRPYLRFDLNDDSIPDRLARQPLTIAASHLRVRILQGDDVIFDYPRS